MFVIPQWAKNKVVYQIFPSRFATTEDVPEEQWYTAPISFKDNLKGNLRGIINQLPHIKELGIELPLSSYIANKLIENNVKIPKGITNENTLLDALWKL